MPETNNEALPAPPPAPSKRRKKGGGAKFLMVMMTILALVGVIVYLLSLLNSKKFFLVPEGDKLVVKKGVFFLAGSEDFKSTDPEESMIFAPIDIPAKFGRGQKEFDSKESLAKEFGAILIDEASTLVFSPEEPKYQKGKGYLRRLDKLTLSAEKVGVLKDLKADVSFVEAKRAFLGVEKTLENARRHFELAAKSDTSRFHKDAPQWLARVEHLLDVIRLGQTGKKPEALTPGPKAPPVDPDEPTGLQEPPLVDEPEPDDLAPPSMQPAPIPHPKGGI